MVMEINWWSKEITQICANEARLKQLQVKASRITIEDESMTEADRAEVLMVVPSIIRSLRIALQERKLENL